MSQASLSVNRRALKLVSKIRQDPDKYCVLIKETDAGTILIDAGINAKGGFEAGKVITEICLGGYGQAKIYPIQYDELILSSVFVYTSYPAISTLGSQFADWQIKQGKFNAIGSGPARALARKNHELFEKIGYEDKSEDAVLVLETGFEPPEIVVEKIVHDCGVSPGRMTLILVPTTSTAGSTQVSGRIVETGLHKLLKLGLDPKLVTNAYGSAPIAPSHPKSMVAMGRTNDAILYAGFAHYDVKGYTDEKLKQLVDSAPSSASKNYGQPFEQTFRNANCDFYKIDPNLFAPAVVSASNLDSGSVFNAGKINHEVIKDSFGLDKT